MTSNPLIEVDSGSQPTHRSGPPTLRACNLFAQPLVAEVAHAGVGTVNATRIAAADGFAADCNFLDYVELPPGASIGDHRHGSREEELYLVLDGTGLMRLEADRFRVIQGDLIRNPPGGLHGLTNTGTLPLRLVVIELAVRCGG